MKTPLVFLTALSLFIHSLHAAPPQYTVTVLTGLGGYSPASAVNASGQVTGYSQGAGVGASFYAVRWTGTTPTVLANIGGNGGSGRSINVSGQITGFSRPAGDAPNLGVRWTGTTPTELANPLGGYSYGYSINASGQVAGYAYNSDFTIGRAFRWTGIAAEQLLGIPGGAITYCYGINASGQVVGAVANGSSYIYAVRWTGVTPELLDTQGPASYAVGINDSGQAAGAVQIVNTGGPDIHHAVRWTGTSLEDLGTLGGNYGVGYAINASGDVVGMSDITGNADRIAFLHTGGVMYSLQSLLLPGSGITKILLSTDSGNCINDSGQIAAHDNNYRALLLTPVTAGWPDGDDDGLLDSWELESWGTMIGHSTMDDSDRDGIPELLEEAFGLDPKQPDALPPVVNEGGYLTITITKNPGVTYEVQTAATPDAPAFSPATTTVLVNDATTLKVRDNILIGTPDAR